MRCSEATQMRPRQVVQFRSLLKVHGPHPAPVAELHGGAGVADWVAARWAVAVLFGALATRAQVGRDVAPVAATGHVATAATEHTADDRARGASITVSAGTKQCAF